MTTGLELIVAERKRQTEVEGWTTFHDDRYIFEQLAKAGHCYFYAKSKNEPVPSEWPWDPKWWKPSDRARNLTKAGALYLAEADRCKRNPHLAFKCEYWVAEANGVAAMIDRLLSDQKAA